MTNAEKYQEVFGLVPDIGSCPTEDCSYCPGLCYGANSVCTWWYEEYNGPNAIKREDK